MKTWIRTAVRRKQCLSLVSLKFLDLASNKGACLISAYFGCLQMGQRTAWLCTKPFALNHFTSESGCVARIFKGCSMVSSVPRRQLQLPEEKQQSNLRNSKLLSRSSKGLKHRRWGSHLPLIEKNLHFLLRKAEFGRVMKNGGALAKNKVRRSTSESWFFNRAPCHDEMQDVSMSSSPVFGMCARCWRQKDQDMQAYVAWQHICRWRRWVRQISKMQRRKLQSKPRQLCSWRKKETRWKEWTRWCSTVSV